VTRHDVPTSALLGAGVCYNDVIESLDASGGKIVATYDEAVAVMHSWAELTGRQDDLHAGLVWLRENFDDDYAPAPPPRKRWWTTRTKFGSGRPLYARGGFMRRPPGGVAMFQNRNAGRGNGRK